MRWIRMLEDLETSQHDKYTQEYEILSECRIAGLLKYMDGKILCGGYTLGKSKDGLYSYLLKITHPGFRDYNKNASKTGYHFRDGVVGELIVLFSIFFRCRFYLSATMSGELNSNGLRIKTPQEFTRIQCEPAIHPPIFSQYLRNFATGLEEFLNKVKKLPPQYHQQFILAVCHYLRALREVGIDTEMVFIRLVSAIEALSQTFELNKKDDPLQGKNIEDIARTLNYDKTEKEALRSIFDTRKATKKFVRFIENYSKGYIKGGNYKSRHTKIRKHDLAKVLNAIYSARSTYLHDGEPMYLSRPLNSGWKWDTDPSIGMIIDNRRFSVSQKLPYSDWFEGLVRHCLLNFLEDKIIYNS